MDDQTTNSPAAGGDAGDDADDTGSDTTAMPVDEAKPAESTEETPAEGAGETPAEGTAEPAIGEPVGGNADVKADEPAADEEEADDDTVE